MKPVMLRMDSSGKISQESLEEKPAIDYAARYERLRERADPEGISMVYMTLDHRGIQNHISGINDLMSVASSLESLNETVEEMLHAGGVPAETIQRFEKLANEIAGPLGEDPIVLTDAEGVVSTESLSARARVAYQAIQNNLKALVNTVNQYFLRYRSLTGNLHRQLKLRHAELKKVRYNDPIEIETTVAMAGICDEAGNFDLNVARESLRVFANELKWVVNILAPETITMLSCVSGWLDSIEVADETVVNASFAKVEDIPAPSAPREWSVVTQSKPTKAFTETRSTPTFSGNAFTAISPKNPPKTDVDYLTGVLMGTEIGYGRDTDTTVTLAEDVVEIDNVDTVIDMVEKAMEILDYHDIFNLHSTRLVKELNGLMNAGQRLMQRASAAGDLSEPVVAKLVLAIQAPQAISMRAQSPFRDVLYESVRVVTGVVGLASSVKTALSSAE